MRSRARPAFTVEIKRTRTSGASKGRSESSPDLLWAGQADEPPLKPEAAHLASLFAAESRRVPEPAPSETPRGRILPNLLNGVLNDGPAEAVSGPDEPKPARRSRLRRTGLAASATSRPRSTSDPEPPSRAGWLDGGEASPSPDEGADQAATVAAAPVPARPSRSRSEVSLKPGERWKRRLPRVLW